TLIKDMDERMEPETIQPSDVIQPQVQEKNVRQTTFILVGAIVIVFAAIWVVHKNTAPKVSAAVNEQQLQIESAIAQLTGINKESIEQVDELVKKFYEFSNFAQVKPQELISDPFNVLWTSSDSVSSAGTKSGVSRADKEMPKMELLSILKSKYGNCCMIDDTLLYKGDEINGFEIMEIGDDFVRMQSNGHNTILYLQTE
ncbi:MAG: hypothetical protein PHP01_06315, partial [Phycisphaerae bacterium]|nr:hypothetical protein [Phycisphaerae bacterium]